MKIKKLLAGGMPQLYSTFTPVTVTNPYAGVDPMLAWIQQAAGATAGGSTKSSSSGSDGMPTMKDTLALLKDMKGLDVDVNAAITALQKSAYESSIFGSSEDLIMNYYKNLNIANKVNESQKAYDDAYDIVKSNGGIQEAAVTEDGHVIVKDKDNKLLEISPEEYLKNKDKYKLQTNGSLLYARKHDRNMAFNDSVFKIVLNGTSMTQIQKIVGDITSKLGTSSQSLQGYTAKQSQKIVGGIQALQEASKENVESMLVDGIYKVKLKSESQNELASYAISAIYNSLNENQKAILKLHSNGKESGALELIKEMVMTSVNSDKEFTIDYDKETSEQAGLSSNGSSEGGGKDKSGVAGNWFLGYGNRSEYIIQDESNQGIKTNGNDLPITDGGKSIGITTLDKVASSDYGGVLDFEQATMGNGVKLDRLGFSKVAVDGTKIVGVELPVDPRDPNKPNFALLKKKSEADSALRSKGISNPDAENLSMEDKRKVNQVYKEKGLPEKFDQNGNPKTGAYRRFGMITATTTKEAFLEGNDLNISGMKTVESKNERDNYQSVRRGSDDKYSINNGWGPWDWGSDDLYRGTIFIPVRNNYFNAISSGGTSTYPTTALALGIEQALQATDAIMNTINTQKLQ